MKFVRKASLRSILATKTSLTYQEILDVRKNEHEECLEPIKNQTDSIIVRVNSIFEISNLVL